jgi:branched-chain amino acid transport system ATP-binding protein
MRRTSSGVLTVPAAESDPAVAALETRSLTRRFGGLTAVNGVSIQVASGTVHAVIGPNGAGKSTLVNLLSGDLAPSSGEIMLEGTDITRLGPPQRSLRGLGRSYQKTNVFLPLSVFENARLAAQSRVGSSLRFFRPVLREAAINTRADEAIEAAGLSARRDRIVATLSHGEQRQVEIAMALATAPRVLLLDEPLAGMGAEEASGIVRLLAKLREQHAILLVEHDMDAVFSLADTLTVMVNGTVLETGSPASIRASAAVQAAYLGSEDAHDA